jgi:MinD superfamily P-loop ATPase
VCDLPPVPRANRERCECSGCSERALQCPGPAVLPEKRSLGHPRHVALEARMRRVLLGHG